MAGISSGFGGFTALIWRIQLVFRADVLENRSVGPNLPGSDLERQRTQGASRLLVDSAIVCTDSFNTPQVWNDTKLASY